MKQTDIYTEALTCLRFILLADHPGFQNWIGWLDGAQTGQSFGINICLFHQNPSDFFNALS